MRLLLCLFCLAAFFIRALALPQAPDQFTVSPGDKLNTLSWKLVPDASGYLIKRAATASGPLSVIASNIVETAFTDTNVVNGSVYFYAITALDLDGEGLETVRLRGAPTAPVLDWLAGGAKIEKLAGNLQFTEGPVWVEDGGYLIFSDIPANRLYKWSPTNGLTVFRTNSGQANGNALDLEGRLLTCEHSNRRISRTETNGTVTALATIYNARRFNAPNDLAVKSDGTIWFTDPNYGSGQLQPGRWVFRFHPADPTNTLATVVTNFDQPNGIAFSPDEKKVYIADSGAPHHIRVFDVLPDNAVTNSKVFAVINPGVPDGMRVDKSGRLFTSAGDGVQVFAPDGALLGRIRTPETAANLAFGGPNQEMLFITANTSIYAITRKPDLIIASIQRLPASPRQGQGVRFAFVIKNQGTAPSEAPARLSVSLNGQTNLFTSEAIGPLGPDASTVLLCARPPAAWQPAAGSHQVYALIDFEDRLAESNERNNQTNVLVSVSNPAADTDTDGASDEDELLAGTDPSASTSILKLLGPQFGPNNQFVLRWASRPGISYRVSTKRSLNDWQWIDFPEVIPSAGEMTTWTNSLRQSALFRIRIAP